jgi:hypothetical protein
MKKEILGLLENAISDVGYWRWWTEDKDIFQIELGGVQLYNPPSEKGNPPSGIIALRFIDVSYVGIMERKDNHLVIPKDWFNKLHNDKIEPPSISHDEFTLSNKTQLEEITSSATTIKHKRGQLDDINNSVDKAFIAFWAGCIGIIIVGNQMKVLSSSGVIDENQIEQKSKQWWDYWQKYWDHRDTNNPLPKDYACEVTIPLGQ